jgi:hypothetical protein
MKRALMGFVSVGILAVTIGVESANAQYYRPPSFPRTYAPPAYTPQTPQTPQSRGLVPRGGVRGNAPAFSNPDSPAATGGGSPGYNQNLYNW